MSIFTKIITGEIPSYKVAENEDFIAFLDINPNVKGHTLVVPKKEENKMFKMVEEFKTLEKAVPCKRIGMSVIGLEVPHVHVHLVPTNVMSDMQFTHKVNLSSEEFVALAEQISKEFE